MHTCDLCEYAAKTALDLNTHKNALHKSIHFPCDQCEYSATTASLLEKHKKSKHEKIVNMEIETADVKMDIEEETPVIIKSYPTGGNRELYKLILIQDHIIVQQLTIIQSKI